MLRLAPMRASFVPHHTVVTAEGAPPPARYVMVLHGILGSGTNFRSFARRLAASAPDTGFVLVDLRAHGLSEGAEPPHTVDAAAGDLVRLESALAREGRTIAAAMGHSFGGKVALAYAERRRAEGAPSLDALVVLDSSPGPRPHAANDETPGTAPAILRLLRAMPDPLPSRERFLELVREAGHSKAIADWLAMNVRRDGDTFRLRLDLDAIEAMVADYFARDLRHVVADHGIAKRVDLVIGGRSRTVSPADWAHAEELARTTGRVAVHVLPEAGHWVHVDDPEGVLAVLARAFVARPD